MEELISRIIKEWEAVVVPRKGWSPWLFPTSLFIRDYLKLKGEAYPFEMYRALKSCRLKIRELMMLPPVIVGSPTSFYRYIWILEKLGFIKRTGRIKRAKFPHLKRRFWRRYYMLVEEYADDPRWSNPQKAIGYITGREYYRKKAAGK